MITRQGCEFETFNDGIASIRMIDDDGNAGRERARLRFSEKTVQIDKLVRVPYQSWLTTEYLAVIGKEVYEIKQAQTIADSRPKTTALSLHLTRQRRITDG